MPSFAGFTHSAFTFGYESFVHKSNIEGNDVPPGALISFVQKGLQYLELEANLNEASLLPALIDEAPQDAAKSPPGSPLALLWRPQDGTAGPGNFSLLTSQELITKDIEQLKMAVFEKNKEKENKDDNKDGVKPMDEDDAPVEIPQSQVSILEGHQSEVFVCAWNPAVSMLASG